jgi:hypothetical protein
VKKRKADKPIPYAVTRKGARTRALPEAVLVEGARTTIRARRQKVYALISLLVREQTAMENYVSHVHSGHSGAPKFLEELVTLGDVDAELHALQGFTAQSDEALRSLNPALWNSIVGDPDAPIGVALAWAVGTSEALKQMHDAAVANNPPAMPGANLPKPKKGK